MTDVVIDTIDFAVRLLKKFFNHVSFKKHTPVMIFISETIYFWKRLAIANAL